MQIKKQQQNIKNTVIWTKFKQNDSEPVVKCVQGLVVNVNLSCGVEWVCVNPVKTCPSHSQFTHGRTVKFYDSSSYSVEKSSLSHVNTHFRCQEWKNDIQPQSGWSVKSCLFMKRELICKHNVKAYCFAGSSFKFILLMTKGPCQTSNLIFSV